MQHHYRRHNTSILYEIYSVFFDNEHNMCEANDDDTFSLAVISLENPMWPRWSKRPSGASYIIQKNRLCAAYPHIRHSICIIIRVSHKIWTGSIKFNVPWRWFISKCFTLQCLRIFTYIIIILCVYVYMYNIRLWLYKRTSCVIEPVLTTSLVFTYS